MKSKLEKSLKVVFWILFAAACVALYIYIYVVPDISGALTQTAVLSYESRQLTADARCIVVRSEEVVRAEQAGSVSYYAEENVKTRKSAKVVDVYPVGGTAAGYVLENTGIVSYYVDGYESYFTPEKIKEIDPAWALELEAEPTNTVRTSTDAGQALFKVVNSDSWYVALIMDTEDAAKFAEGQSITVAFSDSSEDQVKAVINSIEEKGNSWLITAEAKRFYEPYLRIRTCDVQVISKTYSGLVVPLSAICCDEDGNEGVLVKQIDNSYNFVRIKRLTTSDDIAIVVQTSFTETNGAGETVTVNSVKLYDEVLRDAEDAQVDEE